MFLGFLGFFRFDDFTRFQNLSYVERQLTFEMEMEEAEKVRYIREGLIEQERLKLNTAQGKRIIPVLLRLQNSLNDVE